MLASVVAAANITFAGAGNQTRINGLGTQDSPTVVRYFNSGNGTLVFSGTVVANGVKAPPLPSCINVTKFTPTVCDSSAVVAIAEKPNFPIKRPRCKGGTWILSDSEACYETAAGRETQGSGVRQCHVSSCVLPASLSIGCHYYMFCVC